MKRTKFRLVAIVALFLAVFVGPGTVRLFAQGGTWATKAPMPTARFAFGTGVVNDIIYAVGGTVVNGNSGWVGTVEAYDPATDSWTTKASMPTARYGMGTSVVNGVIYVMGGYNSTFPGTLEAYDTATNTWTPKASMPTGRYALSTGVVNGIIYAIGGTTNVGYFGTVEAYDTASNSWTTKTPMPTGRSDLSASVVNGIIYVVGGYNGSFLGTVEAYDPATDTWTTKASMPTARYDLSTSVVNGVIYAVGGGNLSGTLSTVGAYDPATNSWTTVNSMPTARAFLGTGVVNGVLYSVGGTNNGVNLRTNEAFTPTTSTTSVTSSANPSDLGDAITFTVSVSSSAGTPTGSVTLFDGLTALGTETLSSGQATFSISSLASGSHNITAQYTPDVSTFPSSNGSLTESVISLADLATLNGNNTFIGNQAVTGTVAASNFVGNGSGLTGVTAAGLNCAGCVTNGMLTLNYALGDGQGGNAVNALSLGGFPASAFAPATGSPNYAPATASTAYVAKAGDTMTGTLTMSAGGVSIAAGNLKLPATSSSTAGVITLGGASFAHAFGSFNTFLGANAGNFTMTGTENTASGELALQLNTTGANNTASGMNALALNTTGNDNTASGVNVLYSNSTGQFNTGSGAGALHDNNGSANTASGLNSMYHNITGSNNTVIGSFADVVSVGLTNATAIGSFAVVGASNSVVFGCTTASCPAGTSPPNVGIGTQTPGHTLDVVGDVNASGGVTAASFTGIGSGLTGVQATTLANSATVNDTQVTNLSTDLSNATTSAISTSEAYTNGTVANYVAKDGDTMTGALKAPAVEVSGSTTTGSVTIGSGGTPITKHLSMTFSASFGGLKPSTCTTLSFPFPGASDGDTIALGVPNAMMAVAGFPNYFAWVSAANTVNIRACNLDPAVNQKTGASGSIRVDIWKH